MKIAVLFIFDASMETINIILRNTNPSLLPPPKTYFTKSLSYKNYPCALNGLSPHHMQLRVVLGGEMSHKLYGEWPQAALANSFHIMTHSQFSHLQLILFRHIPGSFAQLPVAFQRRYSGISEKVYCNSFHLRR